MGGGRLGSDARHHGTLAGKFSIIGSSWPGPLPMFVMAELSCRRELRYHSYSAAPQRPHDDCQTSSHSTPDQ